MNCTLISVTNPTNPSSRRVDEIFKELILWEPLSLLTLVDNPATCIKSLRLNECDGSKCAVTLLDFHSNTILLYCSNAVLILLIVLPVKRLT